MKLALPKNLKQFRVKEKDGLTLIIPLRSKHVWTDEELWFRSVILDVDGSVVSVGFPKFFTFGERPELDERMISDWSNAKIYVKFDGSLIIRSVYKGRVIFRTRGAFQIPEVTQRGRLCSQVLQYVDMFCPELNNPDYMPDYSLLFEWISPNHRIVVDYRKNELIPLATISHKDLSIGMLVNCSATSASFEDWRSVLWRTKAIEGFVVFAGGHFTKVKTYEYMILHDFYSNRRPSDCYQFLKDMVSKDPSSCVYDILQKAYFGKLCEECGFAFSSQDLAFFDSFILTWIDAYNSYRQTFGDLKSFVDEQLLGCVENDSSLCVRGNLSSASRALFVRNMKDSYSLRFTDTEKSIIYKLLGSADAGSDEKIFWSFFEKFNNNILSVSALPDLGGSDE